MTREQLEHVIRAAGSIAEEDRIVIIGSQAILGAYPDAPESLRTSMEADAFPEHNPLKADIIDGCIGELSPFHETYGYYAHGVTQDAAILPRNWRERLVEISSPATKGYVGLCLSPEDLAVSKLLASREKDVAFVQIMLSEKLVDKNDIHKLSNELEEPYATRLLDALACISPSTL